MLGHYFKLPYFNNAVPTVDEVVKLIYEKLGITRSRGSVEMRIDNFMSCDPVKASEGIKGLDAGRTICMPYWQKWSKNKAGLLDEITRIISKQTVQSSSLELVSVLPEVSNWLDLELTVLMHLCYTRVPVDEDNPMFKFFCLWFDKPVDETRILMTCFKQLYFNQRIQGRSSLSSVAEKFFKKYTQHKPEYVFAGKLYWEAALEKSAVLSTQIDSTEIIPVVDTIEAENPIAKLVEELSIAGKSKMTIVREAMRSFPDRNLSLAQWSEEVASYMQRSTSADDSPVSSVDVITEPSSSVATRKPVHRRGNPRLRMRSITIDGYVIDESNPTQMFMEFVEHIGADLVYEMQIPFRGAFLVDKRPIPGYEMSSKLVGDGYYLCTNCNTPSKIEYMKRIADFFSLEIEIEAYYKEKSE